jgi:hypothetical protein
VHYAIFTFLETCRNNLRDIWDDIWMVRYRDIATTVLHNRVSGVAGAPCLYFRTGLVKTCIGSTLQEMRTAGVFRDFTAPGCVAFSSGFRLFSNIPSRHGLEERGVGITTQNSHAVGTQKVRALIMYLYRSVEILSLCFTRPWWAHLYIPSSCAPPNTRLCILHHIFIPF